MDKPQSISQAIYLIWGTIAISVLITLVDKWTGSTSEGEFMFNLIAYCLFCIIPYKLNNRSNATRYVYGAMVALSILFVLGGVTSHASQLTILASFLMLPVQVFIVYSLFQREAMEWFIVSAD